MIRLDRDLRLVLSATIVCVAVVLAVPTTAVRAVFAVPLCLVLPGYALTAAVFARQRVRAAQTLMLALALSLASLALGSLLLEVLPGGLRIGSWALLIALVVLAATIVAAVRRVPGSAPSPRRPPTPPRLRDAVLLLIGLLSASAALVVSRIPLPAHNAVGYTELWMLPHGTPQAPAVRIGVLSAEQHQTTYLLVLQAGPGRAAIVDPQLTLRPGGASEFEVPLTAAPGGVPALVTARLYEAGSAAVYRHVTAVIAPPAARLR
jgi:Protein of unknown function (DUF1616)